MTNNGAPTTTAHLVREDAFSERHYSTGELAKMWGKSRETVRKIVCNEPGVMKFRMGAAGKQTSYSVPESVAKRIHMRMSI